MPGLSVVFNHMMTGRIVNFDNSAILAKEDADRYVKNFIEIMDKCIKTNTVLTIGNINSNSIFIGPEVLKNCVVSFKFEE